MTSNEKKNVGLCWSSNPQDKSMHIYKSTKISNLFEKDDRKTDYISLQTNEYEEHLRRNLETAIHELDRYVKCNTKMQRG